MTTRSEAPRGVHVALYRLDTFAWIRMLDERAIWELFLEVERILLEEGRRPPRSVSYYVLPLERKVPGYELEALHRELHYHFYGCEVGEVSEPLKKALDILIPEEKENKEQIPRVRWRGYESRFVSKTGTTSGRGCEGRKEDIPTPKERKTGSPDVVGVQRKPRNKRHRGRRRKV